MSKIFGAQTKFWKVVDFMKFMSQAKTAEQRLELLKNQGLEEMHNCFPFLVWESLRRNKKMIIGKITDRNYEHFDVVIANENGPEEPLFIQHKEITDFSKRYIPSNLSEWLGALQCLINKAAKTKLQQQEGVLCLTNSFIFSSNTWVTISEGLKKIIFPDNFPYKQVVINMAELKNNGIIPIMRFWQIYPKLSDIKSVTETDIPKFKSIYELK